MKRPQKNVPYLSTFFLIGLVSLWAAACRSGGQEAGPRQGKARIIQNTGSDTMVNLAQAWAEAYSPIHPEISVEVSGGGSGTGIAALINGTVDIANCSRKMEPAEIQRARESAGKEPREHLIGYDALAIYVHKQNPLEEITLEQLAEIYGEKGKWTRWADLGVKIPQAAGDEIIRISRQSNSGTFAYFREAILGHSGDFKLGSRDLHGSKDVVELVSRTPGAIGYSGMGYGTGEVKKLRVARKAGEKAVEPNSETTLNGTYPISRPLLMYTLGEPDSHLRAYLDWIHSDAGQAIVTQSGYVALPKN